MKSKIWFLWILCVFLCLISIIDRDLYAQSTSYHKNIYELSYNNRLQKLPRSSSEDTTLKRSVAEDFNTLIESTGHVITKPFHWNKQNLKTFGYWAGATLAAVLLDETVRDYFQRNKTERGDNFERIGYYYGSPFFTVPFSLLTYATGTVFHQEKIRDTGLMMSELILLVGVIQQPLRIIVGRARPYAHEGNLSFHPFSLEHEYASFISGHCWSAVGISTILAKQIDNPWATGILAALAVCTMYSRMYEDAHWFSDVLMGSALGYYSATSIVDRHHEKEQSSFGNGHLLIYPYYTGIGVTYKF